MADDLSAAARVFTELAERLLSTQAESRNVPVSNATNGAQCSVAVSSTGTSNLSSTPLPRQSETTSRAHSELQGLFPHHFTSRSRQPANNRSRSNGKRRDGSQRGRNVKKARKPITRKFFCLADKDQFEVPEREDQRQLLVAGLGEYKVSIDEDANEDAVRERLVDIFPKLKDSGGFELMYVECRSRELLVIPQRPDGLTMKYLASFIGQGKIYIRLIQQDLALGDSTPQSSAQKERCRNCHAMVELTVLREHYNRCAPDGKLNTSYDTHTVQLFTPN